MADSPRPTTRTTRRSIPQPTGPRDSKDASVAVGHQAATRTTEAGRGGSTYIHESVRSGGPGPTES